jgi:hypothetical protein
LIDAFLFRYIDDPTTIKAQEIIIQELRQDGTRTTAVYELREGSSGGEVTYQADQYVQEITQAEDIIRVCQERMALINKLYCECFSKEEQEFIRLFWFDIPRIMRGLIWERNREVIKQIRWFMDPEKGDRPSQVYYDWRKRIYGKWWELLFGDAEKE